ncbi:hypothetical protein T484DRAFT_1773587 [Baffinella frigidus]|nr:hypothetical protein T484DRAFT_1773587 [Cryptophyta sp. CCMP2293]
MTMFHRLAMAQGWALGTDALVDHCAFHDALHGPFVWALGTDALVDHCAFHDALHGPFVWALGTDALVDHCAFHDALHGPLVLLLTHTRAVLCRVRPTPLSTRQGQAAPPALALLHSTPLQRIRCGQAAPPSLALLHSTPLQQIGGGQAAPPALALLHSIPLQQIGGVRTDAGRVTITIRPPARVQRGGWRRAAGSSKPT